MKKPINEKNGEIIWVCQCDCGNLTEVRGRNLRDGHTTSCGCKRKEAAYNMGKATIHDLTGQRFGHLLVIENTNKKYTTNYIWKCKCDCGNKKIANGSSLRSGTTKSCGCINYSIGEQYIKNILISNNIDFKKEYRFEDFK